MLKKLVYFIGGWLLCVLVLNKFVFQLILKFVQNGPAVVAMCVITTIVFTIVWGVIVGITE